MAWRDNSAGFGSVPNPLAKDDLFEGKPDSLQDDLLKGVRFLQERVDRVGRKSDRISQVRNVLLSRNFRICTMIHPQFTRSIPFHIDLLDRLTHGR